VGPAGGRRTGRAGRAERRRRPTKAAGEANRSGRVGERRSASSPAPGQVRRQPAAGGGEPPRRGLRTGLSIELVLPLLDERLALPDAEHEPEPRPLVEEPDLLTR